MPQGSILGTLVFIIYINDFARASAIFDFICYADDTTLISTLDKFINAQNTNPDIIINTELAKINEWLEINKLSLINVTKSKFMVFHTQHHTLFNAQIYQINHCISPSSASKYWFESLISSPCKISSLLDFYHN